MAPETAGKFLDLFLHQEQVHTVKHCIHLLCDINPRIGCYSPFGPPTVRSNAATATRAG
jgi:hypothetical protein